MKDILQGIVFVGLFLIPFLPIYVENSFFFPFITGKNFAFRIIIEIVFASWVLLALYEERYRPKFSWILAGFGALLGIMAVADAFGAYPLQSFWSNFERMDGYVTLVHLFLFVVVAGSVFTTNKVWSYFLHLSIGIALLVALHGLGQYFGVIAGPDTSRVRIDSRLGNAAYMAIYMLFHIFFLFLLFVRSKNTMHKIVYTLASVLLSITLLFTGTRGTFLGLVVGFGTTIGYIALFGRAYPELRKIAIGACAVVIIGAGGFLAVKNTAFVQHSSPLARIANISLQNDLVIREKIWAMAWTGFKQRPLLGWGQSNFNFVFNKEYDPSLFSAESWYDRTHDIVFDWLITGGVLGLLAYFSIFFAALYYLFWQPLWSKDEPSFNVLERGVLIGILVGYLVHNLVVFDNIISYIFYGTILALIHARISTSMKSISTFTIDTQLISQFVAPLVILIVGATVYFVNAPGIAAAGDIIKAMTAPTANGRLEEFHNALSQHSFGDQEIVEQLAQQAMSVVQNPNVSEGEKKAMAQRAELELLRMIKEKPGDARLHSFLTSFYRTINALPQAREQAAIARSLSPKKQSIIIEQAIVEIQAQNLPKALEFLKLAFELDQRNTQARILYAATLVSAGKKDDAVALVGHDYFDDFVLSDYALSTVDQNGDRALLTKMFVRRIELRPDNSQNRASLAFLYYEQKRIPEAIAILEKAGAEIPEFTKPSQCFINNLKAGKKPDVGC